VPPKGTQGLNIAKEQAVYLGTGPSPTLSLTKEAEMASVINTNMASLYAQKNLSGAQSALSTSVERLSSGLRINRAKDDAAGLGISEKLKSQIVALNQGVRNANDAVSMVQTAEGSLSEVSTILQRMKELAVQGRNEALSSVQRAYIADELVALKNEVNSISERTTFNGKSLLKNALASQVAGSLSDSGRLVNGAAVVPSLSVAALDVSGANVGSYTLSTGTTTTISALSNVNEAVTPSANSARTVTINEGDVFEGAEFKVSINGQEYSVVAGQDSTASTLATQLVTKLNRDYSGSVSASTNTVVFASGASLGNADIELQASTRAVSASVTDVRSVVDGAFSSTTHARTIVINDHDIVEGRKVTVTVGNPNEVATFSTYIGAGATKQNIAEDLSQLIDNHFSNVSVSGSTITFGSAAELGMSEINIAFEDTVAESSGLTLSTVTSKYGAETSRVIEINENDVEVGRVFALSVNGKEYSYKVEAGDTANTIANKLSGLLDDDYATVAGVAASPTIVTVDGVPGTEAAAVTFTALKDGEAITVAGLKFTASRDATAAEVATAFASLAASATTGGGTAYGAYSGTFSGYTSGSASTATVTFTSTTANSDVTDISVVQTGRTSDTVVTDGTGAAGNGTSTRETSTFTFSGSGLNQGQTIAIGTLTFTAARDLTFDETVSAFENLSSTPTTLTASGELLGTYSGTLNAGWTSGSASSDVITFTYGTDFSAQTDLTSTVTITGGRISDPEDVTVSVTDGAGGSTVEYSTVTFGGGGMKAGDSVTVGGLRFTANSVLTQAEVAAAFASLYDGATYGTGIEYGTYEGQLRGYSTGTVTAGAVRFTSTASDGTNVKNLTASATPVAIQLTTSGNQITLNSTSAKLGLANIDVSVKEVANPGEFTLTAGADTGIGGTSQTVSFGSLAAGGTKNLVFDQLGVKLSLNNMSADTIDSDDFELYANQASQLVVASAMEGEALFQVGAGVRDTVEIDGFKDIRITGYNKNDSQAEREVFDNIHATMTAIAGGDVDESTFATLETQIEEAITTVSTFRSYLGAQQNRIEYAISNIQAQSENLTEANSRIRDTDYAAETANLTKTQIMQQAATAMLAQANQMPNVILALLK
jgi:flagellin